MLKITIENEVDDSVTIINNVVAYDVLTTDMIEATAKEILDRDLHHDELEAIVDYAQHKMDMDEIISNENLIDFIKEFT